MNGETSMTVTTRKLNARHDVAVAIRDIPEGFQFAEGMATIERIPAGHKLALRRICVGEPVVKYGQIIGAATQEIAPGAHVHVHNLGMGTHKQDYAFGMGVEPLPPAPGEATFQGFHRPSGRVGTRNYIGILTTVNCSGSVARFVAEEAARRCLLDAFPNVDGVVPIVHGSGCGMSGKGEGYETLFRTLAGYGHNPNFGAILMLGLGCEVMQVADLVGRDVLKDSARFRYMTIQGSGGTKATIDSALGALGELAVEANKAVRAEAPASKLVMGMQCGGSDGYSGITANPALGVASDILVGLGATAILSETPEIYGAEQLLLRRAVNTDVAEKLISQIRWWENYTKMNDGSMDNNPSPGNKAGGLTTILEKSLGAAAKGGSTPLTAVYDYAEQVTEPGFVFMDTPGYDPVAATGQLAGGAQVLVFTTGRGSAFGSKPAPTIKLATNESLFQSMPDDMDLNCGDILTKGLSLQEKGQEIVDRILEVASGTPSKSESLGLGDNEFVPWQVGAVM